MTYLFFFIMSCSISLSQDLDSLLQLISQRSYDLHALQMRISAEKERAESSSSWPNPMIEFEKAVFSEAMSHSGNILYSVMLKQDLPIYGTLSLSNEIGQLKAKKMMEDKRYLVNRIRLILKENYAEYQFLRFEEMCLNEVQQDLSLKKEISKTAYENLEISLENYLEIEKNRVEVLSRMRVIESELAERLRVINFVLNCKWTTLPFRPLTNLILPKTDSLLKHPKLIAKSLEIQISDQQIAKVQREQLPALSLGISYSQVDEYSFINENKDMFMIKIGLTIPFFNNSYSHREMAYEMEKTANRFDYETLKNDIEGSLELKKIQLKQTDSLFLYYSSILVPQSEYLLKVKEKRFQENQEKLSDLIEQRIRHKKVLIEKEKINKNRFILISRIEAEAIFED